MSSQDPSAFVPALSVRALSRRPRSLVCPCPSQRTRVSTCRRPAILASTEGHHLANDSRHISTGNGFALRDAPSFNFADLPEQNPRFQVAGAYAITDLTGKVIYMGYSKNLAAKLAFHQRLVPHQCTAFRVYVPPVPPELVSPEMLESVLEYWVRENGSVPDGNTVDRSLWENPDSLDRKRTEQEQEQEQQQPPESRSQAEQDDEDIPIRERSSARRVASRRESAQYYSPDPFADTFRSASGASNVRRRRDPNGWSASEDDYVEVDIDPLDPFSATKRRRTTRSSWDPIDDDDEATEEWFPIFALAGLAGLVWLMSVLGNALPAATPSVGM